MSAIGTRIRNGRIAKLFRSAHDAPIPQDAEPSATNTPYWLLWSNRDRCRFALHRRLRVVGHRRRQHLVRYDRCFLQLSVAAVRPRFRADGRCRTVQKKELLMTTHDVVLCSPVRTPIGAYNGSLKTIPAPELGAAVVRETLKRSGSTQRRSAAS